ncbi:MAG: electron transfer flavoprotein subunit beta/FixA family protein [Candidatus Marinimicrobia bacterium]|jgi:electron transfer flavoprotein beta subunit|nr:electron transfer flavoprotein subunit beta/FixA family protein [Candidatus Neomarinimicrobiota bacterium]MBT4359554.1 electron transfer flavoprotein subunit beta/FixA family protein [Candidatus Neomarinimicrobiota bacterium]MBT4714196.1 electron transfer flavoprotein subunit beta/FixA family protein [Candidatus Neomarinimicrobiota bacterium]MBT4945548.1 electron transfer flavoprotein subunit beta/FixA family protein [Candidatus Neomarinimicrobiota bacterium]MBT5314168.1 electron transfer fl
MKIVVPLKQVPDLVEDLEVDATGKALDAEEVKLKLNEFDDQALEEALLLKESGAADEVVAMAFDGEDVDKMLFTAIAKGANKAIKLNGSSPTDIHQLAKAFANAVATEGFDLVMAGVQSADGRDGHLGPIMAEYLSVPCISVVAGVSVSGGQATVQKEYSGGMLGEFEVDLPAVLGIQAAAQAPRYAPVSKVRQIQQTETIQEMDAGDLGAGAGSAISSMAAPEKGLGAKMLDDVEALMAVLKDKGVA